MQVCDIYIFNDGRRYGYLAVLNSVTNGKRDAVKFYGDNFGNQFKTISAEAFRNLNTRTSRSASDFGKYIKSYNPSLLINPININGVVIDLPYIHLSTGVSVQWMPKFEKTVTKKSFSLVSEGLIIEYNFQQPIFIQALDMKRHTPKVNQELLLINVVNGMVSRKLSGVFQNVYTEGVYSVVNGNWTCESYQEISIAGYKMR